MRYQSTQTSQIRLQTDIEEFLSAISISIGKSELLGNLIVAIGCAVLAQLLSIAIFLGNPLVTIVRTKNPVVAGVFRRRALVD